MDATPLAFLDQPVFEARRCTFARYGPKRGLQFPPFLFLPLPQEMSSNIKDRQAIPFQTLEHGFLLSVVLFLQVIFGLLVLFWRLDLFLADYLPLVLIRTPKFLRNVTDRFRLHLLFLRDSCLPQIRQAALPVWAY